MTSAPRDVIIVGGGIIGCLTGYLLACRGLKVTILEADALGSHASGFAFGALWPLEGAGIPDPLLEFSLWSCQRHSTLAEELREESGVDIQFHRRDRLSLVLDEAEVARSRKELVWQRRVKGFKVEWLGREEALKIEPRINPQFLGAIYVQGTGAVDAYRFNLAAAQAGARRGVEMLQRRVTGLMAQGDHCWGVTLETGRLEAGAVVLAMGPWTQKASQWCRAAIPVAPLKGQILRLRLAADPMPVSLNFGDSYAASKPDGLIWAGTTEESVGFDEEITAAARDKIVGDLGKMAPFLTEAEIVLQTACLRPLSRDGLPIVGKAPGWSNLYLATGAGRKGILWSTGMAQGLADLIVGGSSEVPGLAALDPARFQAA